MIRIFTDGGSRGNPGPSALGVYIEKDGKKLAGFGKTLGINTNNFAEYSAAKAALQWLVDHKEVVEKNEPILFSADSQLFISQITGLYRIKMPHLRELLFAIRALEAQLPSAIQYRHIPREQNKIADGFVNQALDNDK